MSDTLPIKCVLNTDSENVTESLQLAFKTLADHNMSPEWITAEECLNIKQNEELIIFICDPFEGPAFVHLNNFRCRIIGPQCILACMKNKESVPKMNHPIYSVVMRGLVVSCTSLDRSSREDLHQKIMWMAGVVSKDFTSTVTHLVAGEVGSKKYHVACNLKRPIMLPEWVTECWNRNQTQLFHASELESSNFRCPIFKGFTITVSQLDLEERKEVKQLVEKQGGKYTGEMRVNECTHLIINEPQGQKYEFARKWKIHCIKLQWLYDSLEKGYCLDEALYQTESPTSSQEENKTSTPINQHSNRNAKLSTSSNISNITNLSCMIANDTVANETLRQSAVDPLDFLDLSTVKDDMFLDGCKIFLSGFNGMKLEKLKKIINKGGGTRFNQINESVSHIVIGDKDFQQLNVLKEGKFRPFIVTSQWLVECFKQGITVSEDPYKCMELQPLNILSPLPKQKSLSDQNEKIQGIKPQSKSFETTFHDDDDVITQYLPHNQETFGNSTLIQAVEDAEQKVLINDKACTRLENGVHIEGNKNEEDDDATPEDFTGALSEVATNNKGIFSQKTFVIIDFDEKSTTDLKELIEENGGEILSINNQSIPDYAVVPLTGCQVSIMVEEVVTNCWLQMCVENEMLLPVDSNELFVPILVHPGSTPLTGCVLSISQYMGTERDCIMHLTELLGARCQEYFVRKSTKTLEASTHLILQAPEGVKYEASKKWGIPAVTKQWLLHCAQSGKRLPEEKFLVTCPQVKIQDNIATIQNLHIGQNPEQRLSSHDRDLIKKSKSSFNSTSSPLNVFLRSEEQSPQTEVSKLPELMCSPISHTSTPQPSTSKSFLEARLDSPKCVNYWDQSNGRTSSELSIKSVKSPNKPLIDHMKTSEELCVDRCLTPSSEKHTIEKEIAAPQSEIKHKHIRSGYTPSVKYLQTPRLESLRIKELKKESMKMPSIADMSVDTPGKFLNPDKAFYPSFDIKDALTALDSSKGSPKSLQLQRRNSMPMEEFFSQNIAQAVEISAVPQATSVHQQCRKDNVLPNLQSIQAPFAGFVVIVSKKLSSKQGELNNIVSSLGGDYRWTYDDSCTHFVFQGRNNDTNKEYRTAKSQGKIIVAPDWLYACQEANARIDESLYPHTYNPKLSLPVISTKYEKSSRRGHSHIATSSQMHDSSDEEQLISRKQNISRNEDNRRSSKNESQAGESLEIREAVSRQLEEILSASKSTKNGIRKSRKLSALSPLNSSGGGRTSRSRSSSCNKEPLQVPEINPEPSQSIPITWDDPTGRLEREKIDEQLRKKCSPLQNSESLSQNLETNVKYIEETTEKSNSNLKNHSMKGDIFSKPMDKMDPVVVETNEDSFPAPTPEAPSIAFPLTKPKVAPAPRTAPEISLDENEDILKPVTTRTKPPPKFLLSGMTHEEKDDYGGLIEKLGGRLSDTLYYDSNCTHLIVENPSRNEKFLAAVAAGKWILHKSYLEACREVNTFVAEEDHEWGGEATARIYNKMNNHSVKLAQAAHHWRLQIQKSESNFGHGDGAFNGWKVIIHTDKQREGGFRRILESGGAKVISNRLPCPNFELASHAFIEPSKVKMTDVNLEALHAAGILCLKPEYIGAYLTDRSELKCENFYIPEIKAILSLKEAAHRKRKPPHPPSPGSKRHK